MLSNKKYCKCKYVLVYCLLKCIFLRKCSLIFLNNEPQNYKNNFLKRQQRLLFLTYYQTLAVYTFFFVFSYRLAWLKNHVTEV